MDTNIELFVAVFNVFKEKLLSANDEYYYADVKTKMHNFFSNPANAYLKKYEYNCNAPLEIKRLLSE